MLTGANRGQGANVRVTRNNIKQRTFSMVVEEPAPNIAVQDNTENIMSRRYRNLIMTPPAKAKKNRAIDTVGSLEGSADKQFSTVRVNLKTEVNNRTPQHGRSEYPSFRPPKPHKNELNCKVYDVAGPGFSVHDLTDNVEIKTQADTFYDHGERERIKMSKYSINQWKPGVKVRDMYTHGFKGDFDKTDPKFGLQFYD